MKFWLVVLGMTAVLVAGSVALAGNDDSTTRKGTLAPAAPKPAPAMPKPKPVVSYERNGLIAASAKGTLVLVDPSNGRVTRVPNTAGMEHPTWSPDARLLAVDNAQGVYTIRPDGTGANLVIKDAASPSWSEDGSRIYVERDTCTTPGGCEDSEEETTVVYTVQPDGTDAHALGEDDVYDPLEAGWPPASHVLDFLENDGSAPAELDSSQTAWSPDGFELAFSDASTGLWIVSVDGGEPQLIAAGAYEFPSWGAATAPAAQSARR